MCNEAMLISLWNKIGMASKRVKLTRIVADDGAGWNYNYFIYIARHTHHTNLNQRIESFTIAERAITGGSQVQPTKMRTREERDQFCERVRSFDCFSPAPIEN